MNEKVISLGYSSYLESDKKKKWTGRIIGLFSRHRVLSMCIAIITLCISMNLMLIYNFIKVLEQSRIL